MAELVQNIGFVYFPSPRGFDHINQVTVVDRDGVFTGRPMGLHSNCPGWWSHSRNWCSIDRRPVVTCCRTWSGRIKLFCTVYDPNTGRYKIDYSLFVGIAVGARHGVGHNHLAADRIPTIHADKETGSGHA